MIIKKKPVYVDLKDEQTNVRLIRAQDLDGYKLSDIPDYINSNLSKFETPNAEIVRVGETIIYVTDNGYEGDEVTFNVEIISKIKQDYIDTYEAEYAKKLADYESWYAANKYNIEAELECRKKNVERDKKIAALQKQIEELKEQDRK